jgi:diguanylate cyclase (GGDEF)-like protein
MSEPTTLGGWLVHVMREADGALSLEEALHVIMDSMKLYFPSQSVAVILIDDDTKELRIKISRQISYTFVKKYHRDGPSPAAERVVLEQTPLLLNAIDTASEAYTDLKLEHAFTSAVLAPIIKNQRGVGYIFCDRANGDEFDASDLLHLQVIGYLIGSLIEKFELIQQSKTLSSIDDASQALQYKAFIGAFTTELQRAKTHDYDLALALMAVNDFRKYIETYGIDQAHALLAEVVSIVKGQILDMDILARFGADEFVLCLSGVTGQEAEERIETIRSTVLDKAVGQGDTPINLTVGVLLLADNRSLSARLQDILAALGKTLVEAKSSDTGGTVIGNMSAEFDAHRRPADHRSPH